MTSVSRCILSGMAGIQTQMSRRPFGMKMQKLSQHSGLRAGPTALSFQQDKGKKCMLIRTEENLAVTASMAVKM